MKEGQVLNQRNQQHLLINNNLASYHHIKSTINLIGFTNSCPRLIFSIGVHFNLSEMPHFVSQLFPHCMKSHLGYSVKTVSTDFSGDIHRKFLKKNFLSSIYHTG